MTEGKEVKSLTYYLPSPAVLSMKTPNISVVLLTDGTNFSRGIAVLNEKDMFDRKRGRSIAMGRAMKAFTNQASCSDNIINRKSAKSKIPFTFNNKCTFMPSLTVYEQKLLSSNVKSL